MSFGTETEPFGRRCAVLPNEITDEELHSEFIEGPEAEALTDTEADFDQPDANFVEPDKRTIRAKSYERKVRKALNAVFRETVKHESTVPDAAALVMYGPAFAEKTGDLADVDPRVRRAVDWIMDGTENPYIAFAFATMPLAMQLYRNHQDHIAPSAIVQTVKRRRAEVKQREGKTFKIPFTKRSFTIRFRFAGVEQLTNDPEQLAQYVFSQQPILDAMEKANITPAFQVVRSEENGAPKRPTSRKRS